MTQNLDFLKEFIENTTKVKKNIFDIIESLSIQALNIFSWFLASFMIFLESEGSINAKK